MGTAQSLRGDFPTREPVIRVGLRQQAARICFSAVASFSANGLPLAAGAYEALPGQNGVVLRTVAGEIATTGERLTIAGCFGPDAVFAVADVPIGQGFHWERLQQQFFCGDLIIERDGLASLCLINSIPVEQYLLSVISSEMSPESPPEFLRAHSIISRSWLAAQIIGKQQQDVQAAQDSAGNWTDANVHRRFDVCADDHCQRYHGIGRMNEAARQALAATRGQILVYGGEICDARFSKCCGGITESFATAWADRDVPYLRPVADCAAQHAAFVPPLHADAVDRFIRGTPRVYCNVTDRKLRERILPDFDCETQHFFRWRVKMEQDELRDILVRKTGIDFGDILTLTPLARGASGRIWSLRISGTKATRVFGKELEIRRILSLSHLYSSAFIVEPTTGRGTVPQSFQLIGAGWGHGVGLCQIGAAAMAAQGYGCRDILRHYFKDTDVRHIYP